MVGTWTLEVIRGWEAVRSAVSGERLAEWEGLVDQEKKVAVYQSPGFVLTWYEVYAPQYEALLLAAFGASGRLVGVMPLAIPRDGPRRVVFAGAEHCEYAGWLASPPLEDELPARCIARLREVGLFEGEWHWRWLAPGTSLGWLDHPALRGSGIAGRVSEAANPLWALQPHDGRRFFAKQQKNYKRKVNHLRKLGEVRLVQLDATTLTDELFAAFQTFYDIRTLARYGVAPFTEDPRKGAFHRRLLERTPEAVLVFVLMAGETPVAFSYNLRDKGRAINCMSPFHSRWLAASPGKLVCDLVADTLAQRGMEAFDLGPGGDPYKAEVATTHEVVRSLRLFSSRRLARAHAVRGELHAQLKRAATAVGVSRDRLQQGRAVLSRLRGRSPGDLTRAVARALRRWIWSKDAYVIFHMDRSTWPGGLAAADAAGPPIRRDALEDFLLYTGSDRWVTRQELMEQAISRLDEGQHFYTFVEGGVLLHYSWMRPNAEAVEITKLGIRFTPEPNTTCLDYSYTESSARGRGLFTRALRHMIDDAFALGAERVMSWSYESNWGSRRPSEVVGLRVRRVAMRLRILGKTWRQEVRAL